jgi:phenylalanine-4-hydroxylase
MNAPLETIPEHLREYITEQDPSLYTPIDQAVWRYVMRVSKAFFAEHGHPLYLQGLVSTGISTDRIPLVAEMDHALRKIGWRAVVINGFIPPAIFLEFQALRILAIACDIRKLENIGYTPSPDIIHEAAGHVPIVADPDYRSYLEAYGEVARNAIITKFDLDLYDSILKLSEIKEDPSSSEEEISKAQAHFEAIAKLEKLPSEAALLTRMAWWTTEYGLIEVKGKPLIYGAGLLSSISESYHCLSDDVKKIPFNLKSSIQTSYDITRPQPQLFVAKSFQELTVALNEFADTMAFRRGGTYGLEVAKSAENTVTMVLDHGIQISGIIKDFALDRSGEESAFTVTGTKQFSFHDQASDEVPNYALGTEVMIPLFSPGIASADPEDLKRKLHGSGLHTKSGLRIQGHFKKEVLLGKIGRVWLLEQTKILSESGEIIFQESQKLYPLIFATKVVSVFGGAADRKNFLLKNRAPVSKVNSHKSNLTPENTTLNFLYRQVREYRDQRESNIRFLDATVNQLNQYFPNDWLLRLELLELYSTHDPANIITAQLRRQLMELAEKDPSKKDMINRGVALL